MALYMYIRASSHNAKEDKVKPNCKQMKILRFLGVFYVSYWLIFINAAAKEIRENISSAKNIFLKEDNVHRIISNRVFFIVK